MSQSTVPRAGAPVAELSFDDVEDTAPSTPYPRMRLRQLSSGGSMPPGARPSAAARAARANAHDDFSVRLPGNREGAAFLAA